MSAKSVVRNEFPEATAIKDKEWSIIAGTLCLGKGKTENVAWREAKSYVMKKVMRRVYQKI